MLKYFARDKRTGEVITYHRRDFWETAVRNNSNLEKVSRTDARQNYLTKVVDDVVKK